jgi:hypothetical protein
MPEIIKEITNNNVEDGFRKPMQAYYVILVRKHWRSSSAFRRADKDPEWQLAQGVPSHQDTKTKNLVNATSRVIHCFQRSLCQPAQTYLAENSILYRKLHLAGIE